jgi:bifunctional non-homologous end joining protein LigD
LQHQYTPIRLNLVREPFDHPQFLFELKLDGWRAIPHVDSDECRLVSRNGNPFQRFGDVAADVHRELRGRRAVLDGELVCLDCDGRPQFWELMRRRADVYFYAFDLLALDGVDLRNEPLVERKRRLRNVIAPHCRRLLYLSHIEGCGVDLFRPLAHKTSKASLRSRSTASTASTGPGSRSRTVRPRHPYSSSISVFFDYSHTIVDDGRLALV